MHRCSKYSLGDCSLYRVFFCCFSIEWLVDIVWKAKEYMKFISQMSSKNCHESKNVRWLDHLIAHQWLQLWKGKHWWYYNSLVYIFILLVYAITAVFTVFFIVSEYFQTKYINLQILKSLAKINYDEELKFLFFYLYLK